MTHFLYGGAPGVATRLRNSLQDRYPGVRIVGTFEPPFRPLNAREKVNLVRQVHESKPDVFWVGLSTPKQEHFMAEFLHQLDCTLMVGVGAAFDYHTGGIKDSPQWVKQCGLQWAHRLLQEPSRLWPRYLRNNPEFLFRIALQFAGWRTYPLSKASPVFPLPTTATPNEAD
jgi:N-acetylglucosaminyldiphosphoundecaprenol N-acetyl-beta-D-mannosaminyltransferase